MATAGGLEIHQQLYHAAEPVQSNASEALAPDLAGPATAPVAPPAAERSPTASPLLRRYDPTVPLTALLVLAILIAGIGAAVHRATNPVRPIVSSLAAGGLSPSSSGVTPTTIAPALQAPAPSASSPGGPSAAIPPAGVQPPAATQSSSCTQMVDSLSTRNSKRTVDIGSLLQTNAFPPLPLPGFEHPSVAGVSHWGTIADYLAASAGPSDATTAQWQQLLVQNGFVNADEAEFQNGSSNYGALVLRFTTAAGARAFNRGTMLAACTAGILGNPHVISSLSGGVNYLITEGPPFRASFVAGDSVVRLHICHCVQAPDDQALAGQWAQAVASQVGAG